MNLAKQWFFMGGSQMLPGYLYRRKITIDNSGSVSAISNNQVLFSLTSSNFTFAHAMTNGEDVVFTSSNGTTILPHWKQSYSSGGQTASIWVKVDAVSAGITGFVYVYYGKAGSTQSSSFASAMTRFPTSATNASYVVRFNDGSGSTAANIGSAGGTMAVTGTWNTNDLFGETTGSLTLNGTSELVSKTGLLDTWDSAGHIKLRFKIISYTGNGCLLSKVNRTGTGIGNDYGDLFQIFVRASDRKLGMQWYRGGSQNLNAIGTNALATGTNYDLSITYNSGKIDAFINGVLECSLFGSLASTGSATPFKIGCNSAFDTGASSNFSNIQINDFGYQSYQPHYGEVIAFSENRTYYQKDQQSKWTVSRIPDLGGNDPGAVIEPDLLWDGSQWVLYYVLYGAAKSPTHEMYRRTCSSIDINQSNSWSAATKVLGGGASGIAGAVSNAVVKKFGSTYYAYFRNGPGPGAISVATSTDGITFDTSGSLIALSVPGSGFGSLGYFNCDVIFDPSDNLYKMLVEASYPGNIYAIGLATCVTPSGTFTLSGSNPKTTMLYGAGTGNYGGPVMQFVGSMVYAWYHSKEDFSNSSVLPMNVYTSNSTDFNTWTKPYTLPVFVRERYWEDDQTSDVSRPIELNGSTYMILNGLHNSGTFSGYTAVAKFSGTLAQLVSDMSISIGSEQAL